MKRVAVMAYCANNFGDDIFIRQVLDRYPDVQFDFFCADEESLKIAAKNPRVSLIDYDGFKDSLSQYALLLVLGGSMFQDVPRWSLQVAGYGRRFLLAKRKRIPIAIVGASFGPSDRRIFVNAYKQLFRLCDWISFRDVESLQKFPGLTNLRFYPDLAFAHRVEVPEPVKGRVGVSVIDLKDRGESYERGIAKVVESLAATNEVVLFSFQRSRSQSDADAAKRILGLVNSSAPQVRAETYDPSRYEEFMASYLSCEKYVTSRFHAMVMALSAGRAMVTLSYHRKIDATLRSLDLDVAVTSVDFVEASAEEIVRQLRNASPVSIEEVKIRADGHFQFVDTILCS